MTIFVLILFITILLLSWHFIKHLLVRKFKNLPPSPFSFPIIGHLHHLKHPLHKTLHKTTTKVGPITLLHLGQKPVLHISSPLAAEQCLSQNDVVFANRPRLLTGDIFGYNCKTLIWAPYGNLWRNLRRISTVQIFSPGSLQLSLELRTQEVRYLLRQINQESNREKNRTVKIGEALFEMTQRIMMKVLAKKGFKGKEMKKFREVIEEVMRIEGSSTIVDVVPWLRFIGVKWLLRNKFRGLAEKKEKFLDDLLEKNKMIEDEEEPGNSGKKLKKTALVQVLLKLQKAEPQFYSDEVIKGLLQVSFPFFFFSN